MDKGRQPAWDGLLRAIRCVAALTNGITINAKLAQARFAPRLAAHPSKDRLGHEGLDQMLVNEVDEFRSVFGCAFSMGLVGRRASVRWEKPSDPLNLSGKL
jgi:hypothetical protein